MNNVRLFLYTFGALLLIVDYRLLHVFVSPPTSLVGENGAWTVGRVSPASGDYLGLAVLFFLHVAVVLGLIRTKVANLRK